MSDSAASRPRQALHEFLSRIFFLTLPFSPVQGRLQRCYLATSAICFWVIDRAFRKLLEFLLMPSPAPLLCCAML